MKENNTRLLIQPHKLALEKNPWLACWPPEEALSSHHWKPFAKRRKLPFLDSLTQSAKHIIKAGEIITLILQFKGENMEYYSIL